MISNVCGGLRCRSESNLGCLCVFLLPASCDTWRWLENDELSFAVTGHSWSWKDVCGFVQKIPGKLLKSTDDQWRSTSKDWYFFHAVGGFLIAIGTWFEGTNLKLLQICSDPTTDIPRDFYIYFFFPCLTFMQITFFFGKPTGLGFWTYLADGGLGGIVPRMVQITLWVESYTCLIFFGGSHAKTLMWFYDILRFLEFCTGFLWQQVDYLKENESNWNGISSYRCSHESHDPSWPIGIIGFQGGAQVFYQCWWTLCRGFSNRPGKYASHREDYKEGKCMFVFFSIVYIYIITSREIRIDTDIMLDRHVIAMCMFDSFAQRCKTLVAHICSEWGCAVVRSSNAFTVWEAVQNASTRFRITAAAHSLRGSLWQQKEENAIFQAANSCRV